MTILTVREMMSSPLTTIPPTMRLPQIKHIMRERGIRRLPVVDRERLIGIISFGDLRNAFPSDATTLSVYELSYLLNEITAADVMRTGVITIEAAEPLASAARLMLEHKISGLVVTERDQPVGMITESDIFRALVAGTVTLGKTTPVVTQDQPITTVLPIV